jgi:hypothetical protein
MAMPKQFEILTPENKAEIDALSQYEMCRIWRFTELGEFPYMGAAGDYFVEQMKAKGGFTAEISKSLGWGD